MRLRTPLQVQPPGEPDLRRLASDLALDARQALQVTTDAGHRDTWPAPAGGWPTFDSNGKRVTNDSYDALAEDEFSCKGCGSCYDCDPYFGEDPLPPHVTVNGRPSFSADVGHGLDAE